LDISLYRPAILPDRKSLHQILHMALLELKIGDLFPDKVGSEQSAGMLPCLAVLVEDAITQCWLLRKS